MTGGPRLLDNSSETVLVVAVDVPGKPQPDPGHPFTVWIARYRNVPVSYNVISDQGAQVPITVTLEALHWVPKN